MKGIDRKQLIIYSLVAILCVGSAFLLSLKFIGKTRAQDQGEVEAAAAQVAAQKNGQTRAAPSRPSAGGAPGGRPAQLPGAQSAQGQPPQNPGLRGALQGNALSELEGFLEPFIYDQQNRRDPFLPFAEYQPQESQPARPLSPAQRFDLDQLHLVGIMWDVREPKAMFMDPDAEVLVLGRDEGIGNKNGYIAAIREGEVVVVEAVRKRGDIIYKTRVLRMER